MTTFIIVVIVSSILVSVFAVVLRLQLGARQRLAMVTEYPDKLYSVDGCYVVGGRYGANPLTGSIGYDRWRFEDEGIAAYVAGWLNTGDDRRSLAMVFFDWTKGAAEREKRSKERLKDCLEVVGDVVRYVPGLESSSWRREQSDCDCNICGAYIRRSYRGRCVPCEMTRLDHEILATYLTPPARVISTSRTLFDRIDHRTLSSGPL